VNRHSEDLFIVAIIASTSWMMSVPARISIFSGRKYNSVDKNNFGPLTDSQGADKSIPDLTVLFENAFLTIVPLGLGLLLLCAQIVANIWRRPDRKVMGLGGGLVWFKRVGCIIHLQCWT